MPATSTGSFKAVVLGLKVLERPLPVTDGTDISASKGGIADARFGSDALCSFYQLQPAIAGAQLKTTKAGASMKKSTLKAQPMPRIAAWHRDSTR